MESAEPPKAEKETVRKVQSARSYQSHMTLFMTLKDQKDRALRRQGYRKIVSSQAENPEFKKPSFEYPNGSRTYFFRTRNRGPICIRYRITDIWQLEEPVYLYEDYYRKYIFPVDDGKRMHTRFVITNKESPETVLAVEDLFKGLLDAASTPSTERSHTASVNYNLSSKEGRKVKDGYSFATAQGQKRADRPDMRKPRPTLTPDSFVHNNGISLSRGFAKQLHTSTRTLSVLESRPNPPLESNITPRLPGVHEVGIREHLRLWQELRTEKPQSVLLPDIQGSEEEDFVNVPGPFDSGSAQDLDMISPSDKDGEGGTDVHNFLRPGDVVGFDTKADSLLAVFIRNFEKQSQYYSISGRWLHASSRVTPFTAQDVFSQQDIDPIIPYLPNNQVEREALNRLHAVAIEVPRDIGALLLKRLQAIESGSAEIYRQYSERLDRAHSLVAHEYEAMQMTLQEIAMVVLQKENEDELTDVMLWAVNKSLVKNNKFRFLTNSMQRASPLWLVNPLKLMRRFEQVRSWMRNYLEGVIDKATSSQHDTIANVKDQEPQDLNPVPRFIRKAKALVERSRAHRSVTASGGIGPNTQKIAPDTLQLGAVVQISPITAFDSMEMAIINCLKSWCISGDVPNLGSTWSLPPLLLRATGLYGDHALDPAVGFLFLKEIGVIAPWENRFVYAPKLRLPGGAHLNGMGSLADARTGSGKQTDASEEIKEPMEDYLQGLRRDWGEMTVYCIDAAGTEEIDDGISLERIEGEDSLFWVHVHIANPSAFINPHSTMARNVAERMETLYLPEKTYPMLSPKMTQEYFSLADNRPVLTFSAKIALDGQVLEVNIQPGWVRNTKRVTYKMLDCALGRGKEHHTDAGKVLRVGRHVEPSLSPTVAEDRLSSFEISEVLMLRQLGLARRAMRCGDDAIFQGSYSNVPDPRVYGARDGIERMYDPYNSRDFIGDPSISWKIFETDFAGESAEYNATALVAEMMIVAGEVAARWCRTRHIPIPYRGTIQDPAPFMPLETFRCQLIDRSMKEKGHVPAALFKTYARSFGQPTLRVDAFPHAFLGTEAYTKVTSPLRRYQDMIVHWQIQAALLYEARHGKDSLVESQDDSYLPFSRATLSSLLPMLEVRERSMVKVSKRSKSHWIMQLLHRAFHFREAVLPQTFHVLVHTEVGAMGATENAQGYTKQLSGVQTDLLENSVTKREGGIKVGDWWEARIDCVNTYDARLNMWPVRLINRDDVRVA
ncbi:MAG: hypothetical protein Q9170_007458 [Blastenia crenularia]